jgi:hypothetical protein
MRQEQHFPYLDKEKEWLGLEAPDLMFSAVIGTIIGFAFLFFTNVFVALVLGFITAVTVAIFIMRKKRLKARGWLVRELLHRFRTFRVIY